MSDHKEQSASLPITTPVQVGSIKKGGYVMIKDFPCKAVQYSTGPGRLGSSKATIVGVDIFTNKKYEETARTTATAHIPTVQWIEYEVADIDEDGFVSLLLSNGDLKSDIKLPFDDEETYNALKKCWDQKTEDTTVFFTVLSACGQEKIVTARAQVDAS